MSEKKYYGLYCTTKKKIICGEYRRGEKLPSKRTMADMTGYSLSTVETAYAMLADEGYIFPKERSGYYVSYSPAAYNESVVRERNSDEAYLTDEGDSGGDFEYSVWFKTIRRVISERGDRLFVKSPGKGCAVLRNAISDYLLRYRGMRAAPKNIIIGSGSEQLYETVVKLLGRNRIYGIEAPSYGQIQAVYEGMGARIEKLPMGEDGIRRESLASGNFDVLHVTPFHSYPTGITTSITVRQEYILLARKKGIYIVEDDFDSEFFLPGQPIESLYSLDGGKTVIYINTFSKSLSPSMRMGYMILPDLLLERYDLLLEGFSCTVPVLEQHVLAEFISSGSFERHLNKMRRKMKKMTLSD